MYIHIYIYIYIYISDSQIVHQNPCFNSFILHNHSFDNQGSEINKNDIFLHFYIMSFTKTQSNIYIYALIEYIYIYIYICYIYM